MKLKDLEEWEFLENVELSPDDTYSLVFANDDETEVILYKELARGKRKQNV